MFSLSPICQQYRNKSNTECGIIRPTNVIYMDHIHYLEVRPYQKVKSIRQAVFKQLHSHAISCIWYNDNVQTAVAAILVFVECPKLIASEVLVVLRPYQNVKSIRQALFKISRSQALSCIGYTVNVQTAMVAILVFVECPKSIASEV